MRQVILDLDGPSLMAYLQVENEEKDEWDTVAEFEIAMFTDEQAFDYIESFLQTGDVPKEIQDEASQTGDSTDPRGESPMGGER